MNESNDLLGYLVQFDSPEALIEGARHLRHKGFKEMEAYTPFALDDLNEILDHPPSGMAKIVFISGLLGAICGYVMQYGLTVLHYPLNVGGRPYHSVPAFVPVTFELTILFAAVAAFVGFLVKCKLPQPYSPLFDIDVFESVTSDGFFLVLSHRDPLFEDFSPRTLEEEFGGRNVRKIF